MDRTMMIRDDRPMMGPMENWRWLLGEAGTIAPDPQRATVIATDALCIWSRFIGKRYVRSRKG
jgi:hypothetical protein